MSSQASEDAGADLGGFDDGAYIGLRVENSYIERWGKSGASLDIYI